MKNLIKQIYSSLLLSLVVITASSAHAASEGGNSGGGGGEDVRIFTSVAREAAQILLYEKTTEKYARQILETLDKVDIKIVSSLKNVCGGQSNTTGLYAYSCQAKIYLLDTTWAARVESAKYKRTESWLLSENHAKDHVLDILHEVLRAGDPKSLNYATNDDSYNITKGVISQIGLLDNLQLNCDYSSDCQKPFKEEILEKTFSCYAWDAKDKYVDLNMNIIGTSGGERRIEIGSFDSVELCETRAAYLEANPDLIFGKNYFCSEFADDIEANMYVLVVRKDYSFFKRGLGGRTTNCNQKAEAKWRSARL